MPLIIPPISPATKPAPMIVLVTKNLRARRRLLALFSAGSRRGLRRDARLVVVAPWPSACLVALLRCSTSRSVVPPLAPVRLLPMRCTFLNLPGLRLFADGEGIPCGCQR